MMLYPTESTSASGTITMDSMEEQDGTVWFVGMVDPHPKGRHVVEPVSRRGSNQHKAVIHGRCVYCGKKFRQTADWGEKVLTWQVPVEEAA